MESGTIVQWAALGLSVAGIITGQVISFIKNKAYVKGEIRVIHTILDDMKKHATAQDKRMDKQDGCISSVKKRATDFITIPNFNKHVDDCRRSRREKETQKEGEVAALNKDLAVVRTDIQKVSGMVQQLLALQTGKVQ